MVTTGQVILAGEVKSNVYVDVQSVARDVIKRIGYTKSEYMFDGNSCGILSALHEQSPDINRGIDRGKPEKQGAGDQGIMFGYATNETENYMPLALDLSHKILQELNSLRRENKEVRYLRPDAKAQVTIEYSDDDRPQKIKTIVISTQHDEFSDEESMTKKIYDDVLTLLIPRIKAKLNPGIQKLFKGDITYHINPTGKFVIGGPHGDTGLTGRKIIVDTYGGKGAHGGGAFSGKDPSKVDRSATYATRHIAKNMVAAGVADRMLIQISYAIGVVEPIGIFVDTFGSAKVDKTNGEIAQKIHEIFDMRPGIIEQRLKLKNPIYSETAVYGHMGRSPESVSKTFYKNIGEALTKEVELFTWEKLDYADKVRESFGL